MQDLIFFITGGDTEFSMASIIAFFAFCVIVESICSLISFLVRGVR